MNYISKELALTYVLNKESIFEKIKNSFLKTYSTYEQDYKKLINNIDYIGLEEYVHTIKGFSLNIGAKPLYVQALEVLETLRFNVWDEFVFNEFYKVLKLTYDELKSL